jgi:hypothetical protein
MSVYDDCFKRYGDHSPTAIDRNINIDDGDEVRSNWFVMPVSRTRDSGPLDESNFHSFLDGLGGESETVEVHRFGHWGPGWYEIIIVSPEDEESLKAAYKLAGFLQDYLVLDEPDLSRREWEEFEQSWNSWACSDFRERLVKDFSLCNLTSDLLDDQDWEWLEDLILSPKVYMEEDGYFYPVTIKATNYEISKYINNRLRPLEIEIEFNSPRLSSAR